MERGARMRFKKHDAQQHVWNRKVATKRLAWPGRKLAALEANAGVPGMADEFDGSGEEEGIGVEEDVKRLATDHGAADPIVRTPICDSDSENALFRVRGISSTLNRRQDFGIVYGTGDRP